MKISSQEFLTELPHITMKLEEYTAGHSKRISYLITILLDGMRRLYPGLVSDCEAERIALYAPLHDIGKLLIPDYILKKKASLTFVEFEIMKTHTTEGAEYIKDKIQFQSAEELDAAVNIALYHHERFDGTGYPHGLKGEDIPLCARIMAMADVYDALRSERPYKKALPHSIVESIILDGDGRTSPFHFDPKVLKTFKNNLSEFDKVY